jgi:hypothetical protein
MILPLWIERTIIQLDGSATSRCDAAFALQEYSYPHLPLPGLHGFPAIPYASSIPKQPRRKLHATAYIGTAFADTAPVRPREERKPSRARQIFLPLEQLDVVRHRGRTGRRRFAILRVRNRPRRGVGLFCPLRNGGNPRTRRPHHRARPPLQTRTIQHGLGAVPPRTRQTAQGQGKLPCPFSYTNLRYTPNSRRMSWQPCLSPSSPIF